MIAQQLAQVVESVWRSVIGVELLALPEENGSALAGVCVTATVYFKGAWPGLLMTTCGEPLARRIAGAMFQQDDQQNSREDVRDAVGEMVNILGGNLKAILPAPCTLSLPAVFDGDIGDLGLLPNDPNAIDELCFESEGERLIVRLVRDEAVAAAAAR